MRSRRVPLVFRLVMFYVLTWYGYSSSLHLQFLHSRTRSLFLSRVGSPSIRLCLEIFFQWIFLEAMLGSELHLRQWVSHFSHMFGMRIFLLPFWLHRFLCICNPSQNMLLQQSGIWRSHTTDLHTARWQSEQQEVG